jgi:ABC-type transport system involved in multi-copper enzyme maturation permease subunit
VNGAPSGRSRVLYHMARADFLERVRRYSFLVTLGMTMYLGYLAATGKIVLQVGDMRGIYNSAWIGTLMSLVVTTFLSLAGFYVVKNTIERDRETRVGQILASTPISKFLYVIGKCVSNFAVLAAMVTVLAVAGIAMQLVQREDAHVQIGKLLAPFVLLALPAMAVVAAIAVLFETIPLLRGGFGNVAYFFVWIMGLAAPAGSGAEGRTSIFDWPGLNLVWHSMKALAPTQSNNFSFSITAGLGSAASSSFLWTGIDWTPALVLTRLAWFGVALAIACLASLFFDRFNPASLRRVRGSALAGADGDTLANSAEVATFRPGAALPRWTAAPVRFRFGAMLGAELRLMLKGQRWWWYAGVVLNLGLSLGLPSAESRGIALCVAWIWPILLWSTMGVRERRDGTSQLLFSSPHPLARQLPAVWVAGFTVALLTGGGFGLRLLLTGEIRGLFAWFVGAAFIPTLALSLGVWSGTGKPFEILYTLLWYVGPLHQIVQLDFMGSSPMTAATRVPVFYLAAAGVFGTLAVAGRRRQLQS